MSRIAVFFAALVCLVFSGCNRAPSSSRKILEEWTKADGKIKVLSTTRMIDDLVGEIGGERVAHIALILGESDPHRYELVKGDDEKFAIANLVVYNGLGLEHGASLIRRIQEHPKSLAVGDEVRKQAPHLILMAEGQPDPHIWMDVSLWAMTVDAIVAALTDVDPDFADFYRQNGVILQEKMRQLDSNIEAQFAEIPSEKRFFVTSHDAFHYFTRRYLAETGERETDAWRERFAAPEGLAPEGQLSVTDIQWIISYIQKHDIRVIFPESNVSRDSLRKILSGVMLSGVKRAPGVRLSEQPLYGDAMGAKGSSGESYLKMMQHNANVVIEEWIQ